MVRGTGSCVGMFLQVFINFFFLGQRLFHVEKKKTLSKYTDFVWYVIKSGSLNVQNYKKTSILLLKDLWGIQIITSL